MGFIIVPWKNSTVVKWRLNSPSNSKSGGFLIFDFYFYFTTVCCIFLSNTKFLCGIFFVFVDHLSFILVYISIDLQFLRIFFIIEWIGRLRIRKMERNSYLHFYLFVFVFSNWVDAEQLIVCVYRYLSVLFFVWFYFRKKNIWKKRKKTSAKIE